MSKVHLVNKQDISSHITIDVPSLAEQERPLLPEHVRVKSKIISLSANNVTYARLGAIFKWWDTYSVHRDFPAPYNNVKEWGIVPAWGYAEILESKVDLLPKGQLLFGFWPTSSLPVDLHLQQDKAYPRLFKEVSRHRSHLMTLYNDYFVATEQEAKDEERRGWKATGAIWATGYNLAHYVFDHAKAVPPQAEAKWSKEDADVRSAVIVQLAASSATARSTTWHLCRLSKDNAPKGLLEASSQARAVSADAAFPRKAVTYGNVTADETIDWITKLAPSRIVAINYGSPPGTAKRFYDVVMAANPNATFLHLVISGNPEEITPEEPRTKALRSNMSPQRDMIIAEEGISAYQDGLDKLWNEWYENNGMEGNQLSWGEGVDGDRGVYGIWAMLTASGERARSDLVLKI